MATIYLHLTYIHFIALPSNELRIRMFTCKDSSFTVQVNSQGVRKLAVHYELFIAPD